MCETPFPFEEARAAGLLLRKATGGDERAYIELSSDTRVRLHLGGPVPVEGVRARLKTQGTSSITADPGSFVIADGATDELLGMISLERRPASRPGTWRGMSWNCPISCAAGFGAEESLPGPLRCSWARPRSTMTTNPCSW